MALSSSTTFNQHSQLTNPQFQTHAIDRTNKLLCSLAIMPVTTRPKNHKKPNIIDPPKVDPPKTTGSNNKAKLKQLQYKFYNSDMIIYHFRADLVSVKNFRRLWVTRKEHGYIETLTSFDPIPRLRDNPISADDTIPAGSIEVRYLPNAFYNGGCALGFRIGDEEVHWMCFNRPVEKDVMNRMVAKDPGDRKSRIRLFDCVGSIARTPNPGGRFTEHKAWFVSLFKAKYRPVKLKLTWHNFEEELEREMERKELARKKAGAVKK